KFRLELPLNQFELSDCLAERLRAWMQKKDSCATFCAPTATSKLTDDGFAYSPTRVCDHGPAMRLRFHGHDAKVFFAREKKRPAVRIVFAKRLLVESTEELDSRASELG